MLFFTRNLFNLTFCKLYKNINILINAKIFRNDFSWLRSGVFIYHNVVLVLCCLKLNFKLLSFASDYVASLNSFLVTSLTVRTQRLLYFHSLKRVERRRAL